MGEALRSTLRRSAAKSLATAALAAVTTAAAAFAVLLAITWQVTLPQAARADLPTLNGGLRVVTWQLRDGAAASTNTGTAADLQVPAAVQADRVRLTAEPGHIGVRPYHGGGAKTDED